MPQAGSTGLRHYGASEFRISFGFSASNLFTCMLNHLSKTNFLLINKPLDWTSHDVVAYIRNRIRKSGLSATAVGRRPAQGGIIRNIKVGHAGTLDPFATGLLIVGVGREATKRLDEFKKMPKTYVATLRLGAISDTYDRTGAIHDISAPPYYEEVARNEQGRTERSNVEKIINQCKGKQPQIPPMHSAKKVGGKKLYELARKGIEVERKPSEIEIFDIKILEYSWPFLKIEVTCSAGTYIRTLAHDIGQKLGVGAYCDELARTGIGEYKLEEAIDPRNFEVSK